jgi:hypothetical protein
MLFIFLVHCMPSVAHGSGLSVSTFSPQIVTTSREAFGWQKCSPRMLRLERWNKLPKSTVLEQKRGISMFCKSLGVSPKYDSTMMADLVFDTLGVRARVGDALK